jgi:molybdenum cofactor guanylyltransferase
MSENITALVLAGGRSLRLGKVKALATVGGKTLMEISTSRVKQVSNKILVVTSQELFPLLSAEYHDTILVDKYWHRGPLGGIYTGLLAADSSYTLVVACDMPFLNVGLLRHIVGLTPGYDAVVPCLEEGKIEPLQAVYSRNCLDIMQITLEGKDWSMGSILHKLNVRYVSGDECRRYDPQLLSFFNINSPQDLKKAEEINVRINDI